MPRIILCPVDGERLITETHTNVAGDTLQRFNCPSGDYTTEWRPITLAPAAAGDENVLLPENTEWFREATEYTAGRMESNMRTRLDGLLSRFGAVTGDNVTLLDALTRVYQAVDGLELTTENIRVEAGSINLNTDIVEALLTTIRDNLAGNVRQLDETVLERRARDGRAFIASTTKLTSSIAANIRTTLVNGAGSGRRMYLDSLILSLSAGPVWPAVHRNPTLNLPTIQRTVNNSLVGGTPAAGAIFADVNTTNALAGGTDMGLTLPSFQGTNVFKLPPLIVPPGNTIGINVPLVGATDGEIKLTWWEEDV